MNRFADAVCPVRETIRPLWMMPSRSRMLLLQLLLMGTSLAFSGCGSGVCSGADPECGPGLQCSWSSGTCIQRCDEARCPAGYVCSECGGSSCPQCRDCVAVCVLEEPAE